MFDLIFIMTRGAPTYSTEVFGTSMRTMPTGIYALISSEFYANYPILAAALTLFSIPVLALYFLFQQQFIAGLAAGPLKH